jgi:hypothetical protein
VMPEEPGPHKTQLLKAYQHLMLEYVNSLAELQARRDVCRKNNMTGYIAGWNF